MDTKVEINSVKIKESPKYVKTSLAGAMCLDLKKGRFLREAKTTCLNLLLTYEDGCKATCTYCGLARTRNTNVKSTFIRVKWPVYSLDTIFKQLEINNNLPFKRICISMVTNKRALKDACTIIAKCKNETGLPVSALISPTVMDGIQDMKKIREAGAERIGIAIDTSTKSLFEKYRGKDVKGPHSWEKYWQATRAAIEVFGRNKVGIHLIAGLGETEREMVETISKAYNLGALTHLFSFFPEQGTQMQDISQPPLLYYRKIQMARYLINEGIANASNFAYTEDGEISDFGIDIAPYIEKGLAFMTSGCPGDDGLVACNRPFGNERPSEPMRNYPFMLENADIELIKTQFRESKCTNEKK